MTRNKAKRSTTKKIWKLIRAEFMVFESHNFINWIKMNTKLDNWPSFKTF